MQVSRYNQLQMRLVCISRSINSMDDAIKKDRLLCGERQRDRKDMYIS